MRSPDIGANVYVVALAANMVSFVTGTVLSWTSSQLTKLSGTDDNPLGRIITESESGWVGALPSVGGIIGPFIYGFLMERIGKKFTILSIGVPFIVAYTMLAFVGNIYLFYLARFLSGLGAGGAFLVVGLYMGEISKSSQRGLLCSSTTVFIIIGILFTYCVGPYTSMRLFNLILAVVAVAFEGIYFFVGPESPHYLVSKGRVDEAENILLRLRDNNQEEVKAELEVIKATLNNFTEQGTILDVFRTREALMAASIGVSLVVLQQLSGINVILAYTEQIFAETNSTLKPAESSIIIGVVQLASSPIPPVLADKFGRRILLLFSTAGCFLSQAVLGTFFYLKDDGRDVASLSWLPILCLVLFILFFNTGFSSLPWTINAEIHPAHVKSIGSSMASIMYWSAGFLLTYFFTEMKSALHMGPLFWIFGGLCCVSFAFVYFLLPETKGKSLAEIQQLLAGK